MDNNSRSLMCDALDIVDELERRATEGEVRAREHLVWIHDRAVDAIDRLDSPPIAISIELQDSEVE